MRVSRIVLKTIYYLRVLSSDSVRIEEEFLARIFLSETDLMIAGAFVDCENAEKALVDTVTYKVSGCKHGLIVKDDTIVIAFKPTSSGLKKVFGNNNSDKE